MAYLDQVFIASSLHHRWDKQQCGLVPMASLKLAIKLLEPRTMNMDDMLKLGKKLGGSFSSRDVVEMEHEIIWKLSWKLFPPTPICFAHHMISLFPREVPKSPTRYILQELTKYMTELAVCKWRVGSNLKRLPADKLQRLPDFIYIIFERCVWLCQVQGIVDEFCVLFSCHGKVWIKYFRQILVVSTGRLCACSPSLTFRAKVWTMTANFLLTLRRFFLRESLVRLAFARTM